MKKLITNSVYFLTLFVCAITIHEAFADRGPAIEKYTEVDIENANMKNNPKGFNFAESYNSATKRKPADVENHGHVPYSWIGPFIFLLALPMALWLILSKKSSKSPHTTEEKVDYYPKTFQFKPFKTDYQKSDEHDENLDESHNENHKNDKDFPKAS